MLDINMGCPKRKIARRGAGAGLLKIRNRAALVNKVVNAVQIPVSAKIRLGWDEVILSENGLSTRLKIQAYQPLQFTPAHLCRVIPAMPTGNRYDSLRKPLKTSLS